MVSSIVFVTDEECPYLSEATFSSQRRLYEEVLMTRFTLHTGHPGGVNHTHRHRAHQKEDFTGPLLQRTQAGLLH